MKLCVLHELASGENNIKSLIKRFLTAGLTPNVGSLNIRQIDSELLELLSSCQKNITLAPETTESLRKTIGKGYFSDEQLFEKIQLCQHYGFDLTLYFLGGIKDEQITHFEELLNLLHSITEKLNQNTKLNIHYNPMFPKAQTPMQHTKMLDYKIMRDNLHRLEDEFLIDSRVSITSIINDAMVLYQPILSLGGALVGKALKNLADIDIPTEDDWERAFKNENINVRHFISSGYDDRYIETKLDFYKTIIYHH